MTQEQLPLDLFDDVEDDSGPVETIEVTIYDNRKIKYVRTVVGRASSSSLSISLS